MATLDNARQWALLELDRMGLKNITWNQAREMLHDGRMSQDVFDLYDDAWNISTFRFSVARFHITASERNIVDRYLGNRYPDRYPDLARKYPPIP